MTGFHIFALITTLVAGHAGPAGTHFGVLQLQTIQFPDQASCDKAVKSAAFQPIAQSLGPFLDTKVADEYKGDGHLKAEFVCTGDTLEVVTKNWMPDYKPKDSGI